MLKVILLLALAFNAVQAVTVIDGGVLAASDTTGTNARPSAVTITARTNLASGTLQVTNVVTLGAGATAATLQTDTNGTLKVTGTPTLDNIFNVGVLMELFATNTPCVYVRTSGGINVGDQAGTAGYTAEKNQGFHSILLNDLSPNASANDLTLEAYSNATDAGNLVNGALVDIAVGPGALTGFSTAFTDTFSFDKDGNPSGVHINSQAPYANDGSSPLASVDILVSGFISYKTRLNPTASDGQTPYIFSTSVAHTSGNIGEVKNDGTNIVQITATTATSTNTPFILNINGTQKPVWLGPPDSGGTGLRALTVAN